MTEAKRINKVLADKFGRELTGEPRFRVVWSDSQFELRRGEFNEFHGSIYLRTVAGVKQVPKYPFIKSRFVLERLAFINNPELPASRVSYEPVYVFESARGENLPLSEKVAIMVVYCCLNPMLNELQRKNLFEELEKEEFQKEVRYFEEILDEGDVATRLHDRDGIILNPFEGGSDGTN